MGVGEPGPADRLGAPLLVFALLPGAFGGLGGEVARVAVAVAADRAGVVVDLQDGVGDPVEERPVVGDGDECAAMGAQPLLQPRHRLVVQVVRGLVEQQQFGGRGEGRGQGEPGALTAGERAEPS